MRPRRLLLCSLALSLASAGAQTPPPTKQTPPAGIAVPANERTELAAGIAALGKEIDALRIELKAKPELLSLLPDVQIFHNAVRYALTYDEFFDAKQFAEAKAQLALGMGRAKELRAGKPGWVSATGLVVRGYVSKIDGSVQPYGLVIPPEWKPSDQTPRRLDFWMHGRNDKLSELSFIADRLKSRGEFTPAGAIVLHLYGRFCNANKFAGEVDLFEAWEDARRHYRIDPNRVSVLGFSMGGASTWHMATHHAGLWAAASPGAGFAETAVYNKVFEAGKTPPPWWEQVLWRWYDATAYAANLANCPLVAYSGEIDPQKQSADIMEKAAASEGLKLERLIGPQTAHKYHPETKKELARRIDELAGKGREVFPAKVRFVTYTLRYDRMEWVEVNALEKHWERTEVNASRLSPDRFEVTTRNVAAFTITLPASDPSRPLTVKIDGQELAAAPAASAGKLRFVKKAARWSVTDGKPESGLHKVHGLSGPIDDAFLDSFVFVRPTGQPLNPTVGTWATAELERAIKEWRRVFRGEARVVTDAQLRPEDIADSNLVLWGDPSSNSVLKKLLPQLPLTWTAQQLALGGQKVDAASHAPVLIFPNPLNPKRYVVINSSFTFREGSNTTNSQQTPKLPDWAVVDLKTAPTNKAPGQIVDAGFFDEQWALPATASRPATPVSLPKP